MLNKKTIHISTWIVYFLFDNILNLLFLWQRFPTNKYHLFTLCFSSSILLIIPKVISFYTLIAGVRKIGFASILQKIGSSLYVLVVLSAFVIVRQILILAASPYLYENDFNNRYTLENIFSANSIATAITDFVIFVGLLSVAELYIKQINGLQQEKKLIKEKLQSELSFLKSQINPHFLFNTLNNIYALTKKQSDASPNAVIKLTKLLRFTLYETANKTIPLINEIKIIEDYIELERIRYNERLTISFNKQIEEQNLAIAPLILLPFVENAFKHGISETINNCFIDIRLTSSARVINFEIENSKEDIIESRSETQIGLKNISRQLELIYPEHELLVVSKPSSFTVKLKINLDSHVAL